MLLIRVTRRLSTIGATIILISSVLRWIVINTPIGPPGGTPPPLSIPILGVALLILSFFPATGRWRNVVSLVLIGAAIASGIITLWALAQSILQVMMSSIPEIRLGAGPVVALMGAILFTVGVVAFIQDIAGEKDVGHPYTVVGLETDTISTETDSLTD